VRAPLSRAPRRLAGARVSPRGVALSAALHGVLALAVWLAPVRPGAREVAVRSVPAAEEVGYVDIGAWPGPGGGAAPAPASAAGPEAAPAPVRVDTATVRVPARVPELGRFPQRAPAGIPRAAGAGAAPAHGSTAGGGAVAGAPGNGAGAGGEGTGRTGAMGGRLSTELGDRRLVVTPQAAPERPLTDKERLQARIAARIGAINDSILDADRRAHRAENWTVKDRNGREWGVAKGGVPVVAGVRLPTTVSPPGGRTRESELGDRERKRQRDAIDAQEATQAADANMRDRARATRERMDRERQQRREQEPAKP
jgi:hypothetical protein